MPVTLLAVIYAGVAVAYGFLRWTPGMTCLDVTAISLVWPADLTRRWIDLLLEPVVAAINVE